MRILTLTMNPCIDKNTSVDKVFSENKMRCERPHFDPGGGGINVSRAIRKLGGESVAFYTQGGPTGEMLSQLLEKEGLTHKSFPIQDWTRENFIALETATGLQFRFGLPGPGLYDQEWENILKALADLDSFPDFFVLSGSLPLKVPSDFYARCVRSLRTRGARIVLDTSKEPLRLAFREGLFLLKPNLVELEEISGQRLESIPAQKKALVSLIQQGVAENIVVSLGSSGALGATRTGCYFASSPEVPVKSKVGAGDSMVGGLVLGFSRGWDFKTALAYGVAAGTAAVMTPGTELCRFHDVESLFPRISVREI